MDRHQLDLSTTGFVINPQPEGLTAYLTHYTWEQAPCSFCRAYKT